MTAPVKSGGEAAPSQLEKLAHDWLSRNRLTGLVRESLVGLLEQAQGQQRKADALVVEYLYDHGLVGVHKGEMCVRVAQAIRDGLEPPCGCDVHTLYARGQR